MLFPYKWKNYLSKNYLVGKYSIFFFCDTSVGVLYAEALKHYLNDICFIWTSNTASIRIKKLDCSKVNERLFKK